MTNALRLLEEMKESKITPNTITYNSAISACEKAGDIPGAKNALKLLQEMEKQKITVNTRTYNSAISACEKAGGNEGMKQAINLLQKMKANRITPDTITYNAAISACGNSKSHNGMIEALTLLQEMKEKEIPLDTITYNVSISACEEAGGNEGMKQAINLLQKMKDSGMLNNKLGKTTLNLHKNTFYSEQIWTELSEEDPSSKFHIPGIHPALARTYLNDLLENHKTFPRIIIVGQHGDDSLKNAVVSFLTTKDIKHTADPSNPGQININPV